MQRYKSAKIQKCKMWNAEMQNAGAHSGAAFDGTLILLYDQYLLLLMSRIAVLCCYVHSEREKQSTPHWSSSCSSWYSYSKYSWSITCYPGHYCLRSCSSPSCWRLCLSGSGRSPCGVIAIIIIIIMNIVLSSIHKWITIFSITFSIHSHDLPCYCVRLICCSRFAGIEADNILI